MNPTADPGGRVGFWGCLSWCGGSQGRGGGNLCAGELLSLQLLFPWQGAVLPAAPAANPGSSQW